MVSLVTSVTVLSLLNLSCLFLTFYFVERIGDYPGGIPGTDVVWFLMSKLTGTDGGIAFLSQEGRLTDVWSRMAQARRPGQSKFHT